MIYLALIKMPDISKIQRFAAVFWMGLWGAFRWMIHHDNTELMMNHILAIPHVVISQIALVLTVLWCVCRIGALPVKNTIIGMGAVIAQGLCIVIGMFWAYDAPDWGAFWQWDYIELSALYVLLSLYAGCKESEPKQSFWSWVVIVLLFIQSLSLYAGFNHATRHGYEMTQPLPVIAGSLVCLLSLIAGRIVLSYKNHTQQDCTDEKIKCNRFKYYISRTCGLIMVGMMMVCGFGQGYHYVPGLCILTVLLCFGIIFGTSNPSERIKKWVTAVVCGLTVIFMFVLPVNIHDSWIKTDMESNQMSLYGVELIQNDPCIQYKFQLGIRERESQGFGLQMCDEIIKPEKPLYYIMPESLTWMRMQVLDYKANRGVLVRIRDCRLDVLFGIWLLFWMILGSIFLIRDRSSNHESKSDLKQEQCD